MELKRLLFSAASLSFNCLNRTFYGIETTLFRALLIKLFVLIVPFMELKQLYCNTIYEQQLVLIVPFMELKHRSSILSKRLFRVLIVPFMELKLS